VLKSCHTESKRPPSTEALSGHSSGGHNDNLFSNSVSHDNKARHLPIFLIRRVSASMKPLSLNLTLRSCWSTYTRQKKRFSTVCKSWHKAPTAKTIKLRGRPLRMLWQASAFCRGRS